MIYDAYPQQERAVINILLADDHSLVRAGLKRVIEESPDIRVLAEASDGAEAISQYERVKPDVVVMDISMPGIDGLESAKQLLSLYPEVRILILTRHQEEHYAIRTIKAGCLGYLTKGTSTQQLHDAIRAVFQGRRFLTDEGRDIVDLQFISNRSDLDQVKGLSDRELQVLCLIARGRKLKEAAAELSLSIKTVETYRANVLRKLCLRNNVDICRFALENGLIDGLTSV